MASIMINEAKLGVVKGNVPTISQLDDVTYTLREEISETDRNLRDLIYKLDRANKKSRWINAGKRR